MQIINDLLLCLLLSTIPAAFSYFLDYCLGHPMSDDKISTKAIFFRYSLWLAKKAIEQKKEREIVAGMAPLLNSDDPAVRKQGQDQLKTLFMIAGRENFTYQQALGMCPYCTNFWICMIAAVIFYFTVPLAFINPFFFFLLIPIHSHIFLRKL